MAENSNNSIPKELFGIAKQGIFSGSAIKLFALVVMTIDHIGVVFCPIITPTAYLALRAIGRLAMPLFAYMIAEGASYTRNKPKYFALMAIIAILSFIFTGVFWGDYYINIFGTFTFSLMLIFAYQFAVKNIKNYKLDSQKKSLIKAICGAVALAVLASVLFICFCYLPYIKGDTLVVLDYGFFGVLLPVSACIFKNKFARIGVFSVALFLMAWDMAQLMGSMQYLCFLAIPILLLYNGKRGKHPFKYGFYLYYPIHLGVLELIFMLIS